MLNADNMLIDELLRDEKTMSIIVATVERILEKRKNSNALITRDEAAQRLKVSKNTLWRWEGIRVHVVKIGKKCFYREGEIASLEKLR